MEKKLLFSVYNEGVILYDFSSFLCFYSFHKLTVESHDEHGDGNNPGDPTVRFPKLLHQVLEEDTKALDATIGENLHQEEGHSNHPPPASIRRR